MGVVIYDVKTVFGYFWSTVNSKIFMIILFSQIALKDIFATLKIPDWSIDLSMSLNDKSDFDILGGFFFRETLHHNKTLPKISSVEFTVFSTPS